MKRILIIGSGGAGKTTLARQLGKLLDLPVVHLDALYWQPGWTETPKQVWNDKIQDLLLQDSWVMDGNYGGTLDQRIVAADTIIFLDISRLTCLFRVIKRYLRYYGRTRPELSPNCPERLTWQFIYWIWNYPQSRRPAILARLDAVKEEKRIVVLHSSAEVRHYLSSEAPRAVYRPLGI